MYKLKYYIFLFIITLLVTLISCSDGDRSPFYQKCLKKCKNANCTLDGTFTHEAAKLQERWDKLLGWGCDDECRYHCMWRTVQGYQESGHEIPKFHGKWPFRRIMGVQEPASAFASILNLLIHIHMYKKIRREFPVKDTPMILFWHCFAWVCINAWVWSAVFHTRDKFFTEFMDYASALSMVMSLLIAAIARILYPVKLLGVVVIILLLLYYVEHVRYLYTGKIDYDYNMLVNVFFGVAGCTLWLAWAGRQYLCGRPHVARLAAFTLLTAALSSMELLDFPPWRGWDAHALWHLSTALLPLLFYRFVIDDLRYLRQASIKSDLKLP